MGTEMGDVFAPWHIILLVIAFVVLFGYRRLPGAAQSLGQSMHIFKKSVQGLTTDDQDSAANPAPTAQQPWVASAPPPAAVSAPDATQQQLLDLQRQVQDLQRQSVATDGQPSDAQTSRPI
ncbi:MAG TPA: twin-arginine translocase TatA/TatE family subunit [Streptosporangiaceae bacterium]